MPTPSYRIGLEWWRSNPQLAKDWGRCGLVANQASVTFCLEPSWSAAKELLGDRLKALFGPQHGFESTVQDNMIESGHGRHVPTGLPVYSLYSETREPTAAMLKDLDTVIVDLPVVGCRIYTYKYTLAGCLRAAKKYGKRVVVLDRPNPLGGEIMEGRVLDPATKSFVGEFPIPMRHGMTMGECAQLFNATIGAELSVVTMQGWQRSMIWTAAERPFVLMSPNMPSLDSAYVFPGMVLFEGTNVSEGRGTTLPFQFVGAPFIKDARAFVSRVRALMSNDTPGVYLREASFQPTNSKWKDESCQGLQIHVLEPAKVRSFSLAIAILRACYEADPAAFKWRDPPYEYEHKLLPIEILFGSIGVGAKLTGDKFDVNEAYWQSGVTEFASKRKPFLLY